jgi:hypothetical protein
LHILSCARGVPGFGAIKADDKNCVLREHRQNDNPTGKNLRRDRENL